VAALKCHASQMRELNKDDLEGLLRERYKRRAKDSQYEVAESFHRVTLPG